MRCACQLCFCGKREAESANLLLFSCTRNGKRRISIPFIASVKDFFSLCLSFMEYRVNFLFFLGMRERFGDCDSLKWHERGIARDSIFLIWHAGKICGYLFFLYGKDRNKSLRFCGSKKRDQRNLLLFWKQVGINFSYTVWIALSFF